MKFVRFAKGNFASYGVLEENNIYVIDGDIFGHYRITDEKLDASKVRLLAPCAPSKIVAVGLNYRDHIKEMKFEMPTEPVIFIKPSSAVIGPEEAIIIPSQSDQISYEAEMGLVIKKTAKNVKAADAMEYVLGAVCVNDVTARDLQKKDGQWTRAKSFDTFAPLGPCIADNIDYDNQDIELLLNGSIKQKSNTFNFVFNVSEIIRFVSEIMTLYPGDIISTGTPSGVGMLNKGDIVEVRIGEIGTLRNKVI